MNAPPSVDPANDDSVLGTLNTVLQKFLQGIDDMLPARVVSYDRVANRATVMPVVSIVTTDGAQVGRATVSQLPVFQFGGGGVALSFNLKPGDLGWIKANDRDISLFLQSYGTGGPNTFRKHSFEDAMFFPDAMRDIVIAGEDEESATLQSLDGTVKVSVGADTLILQAGSAKIVMGPAGFDYTGPGFSINGIPFGTHRHGDVTTGTDISGVPIP